MANELVEIGRVVKPHGIRGEVVVHPLTDVPGRFAVGSRLRLDGVWRTVVASREHQGRLLIGFEGFADRNAAERLRGGVLEAPAAAPEDFETYFAHELVGVEVLDPSDCPLGKVSALVELPPAAAYDLLEVRREDGSTWLLPAVEEYVQARMEGDRLVALCLVNPPEGLVELEGDGS